MPINDADAYRAYLAAIKAGDTVTMAIWTPNGMVPQQGMVTSANTQPFGIGVDARKFSPLDGHTLSTKSYLQAPGFDIDWQAPFAHEEEADKDLREFSRCDRCDEHTTDNYGNEEQTLCADCAEGEDRAD